MTTAHINLNHNRNETAVTSAGDSPHRAISDTIANCHVMLYKLYAPSSPMYGIIEKQIQDLFKLQQDLVRAEIKKLSAGKTE